MASGTIAASWIPISSQHVFLQRNLFWALHQETKHSLPSTLLAVLFETYHVIGAKTIAEQVSHSCITCQKAYAKAAWQQMGQLPVKKTNQFLPSTPQVLTWQVTSCATEKLCKPKIKIYACLFVCLVTRAVNLELLSDKHS